MTLLARWLGQAGFLFTAGKAHLAVDPYLSDSLAEKYAGRLFPHTRMRPAPLGPLDLPPLVAVLCTHAHTDHMDPGTLTPLMAAQPMARLVCPRPAAGEALRRSGAAESRLDPLRAGERTGYGPFMVTAVPSAHEERTVDEHGDDRFLGYVIDAGGTRVYHSGDCAPWDGLAAWLSRMAIDVALLPVNGRDAYRRDNGVPGNFTFDEAVRLCAAAGIGTLVPHHWGMFAFNTADPADFDLGLAGALGVTVTVPQHGATAVLRGRR
ncbi:MBL fold metallo-hydrolase [Dactylosporangium sp. CS-047395]|uniref:MBL fold metallo-hydrolase n=1 Tax=Dactylosporangium sp. CS-047395 TaxID=3239936 RepID=UPI003D8EA7E7